MKGWIMGVPGVENGGEKGREEERKDEKRREEEQLHLQQNHSSPPVCAGTMGNRVRGGCQKCYCQ